MTDPAVPQKRVLHTAIPGPRSTELHKRKLAAVSAGVSTSLPIYVERAGGGILGSNYTDIFAFIVLIAMLTLRPSGLLGERVADRA